MHEHKEFRKADKVKRQRGYKQAAREAQDEIRFGRIYSEAASEEDPGPAAWIKDLFGGDDLPW